MGNLKGRNRKSGPRERYGMVVIENSNSRRSLGAGVDAGAAVLDAKYRGHLRRVTLNSCRVGFGR